MNIRCPNCQTTFRVDPARVPPAGVRARCSRCTTTFHVDAAQADAPQPAAAPAPPAPATPPAAPSPRLETRTPPAPAYAPPAPPTPAPPPATPPPAPEPAQTAPTTVFGSRDPSARAQRIARALVSDIVAYHPKRRDACLAAGTLRTEFREEIMKSWEEYVAQVGLDMAKSTPYFRDALNAILANGQGIF